MREEGRRVCENIKITKRTQTLFEKANESAYLTRKNEPKRTQNEAKKATGEAGLIGGEGLSF
jgi:hypothetical protein